MSELNIDADQVFKLFQGSKDKELADIRVLSTQDARKTIGELEGSRGLLADLIY